MLTVLDGWVAAQLVGGTNLNIIIVVRRHKTVLCL